MTQKEMIEQEAEYLTNKKYEGNGYFGGETTMVSKGVVKSIKYFDHQKVKQEYINQLTQEGFGDINK